MDIINRRRSIRTYLNKRVEPEKVIELLKAGMQAPSAANQQPWEFLVIEDKEMHLKLSAMSTYAKLLVNSPLAIVLLGNRLRMRYEEDWQQDMSAAAENILLEAVNLDLGAVWLGVFPERDRVQYLQEILDLPSHLIPFNVISVGYPNKTINHFVDRFDEDRIHYEKVK